MKIAELPIPKEIIEELHNQGITSLYPPQVEAINKGLLKGNNLVVAIPTASGKTLLALLASARIVEETGYKVLYLAPLRALAHEKYLEFRKFFSKLKKRTVLLTGDYDIEDSRANYADIIIATNEKIDSALRHKSKWLSKVGLVISDEVHLINSINRGPTLEVVLAQLKQNPNVQILALSATIRNADELSRWLEADLVSSTWRPVELHEGVAYGNKIIYKGLKNVTLPLVYKDAFLNLLDYVLKKKYQSLVFLTTRKTAETTAKKISAKVSKTLTQTEKESLAIAASRIIKQSAGTKQAEEVAKLLREGVAFHHAGLSPVQRRVIEAEFKKGNIKVLTATPTLCLSKDTKIWHEMEETAVCKFDINTPVFALKENKLYPTKVSEIQKNFNSNKLIRISTVAGFSIKVTPNHKMLIKRAGEKKIVSAQEILSTDKIATVGKLNIKNISRCYIKDFLAENEAECQNMEINESISYLIGAMLGDGYSGAETINNKIYYKGSASLVNKDIALLNKVSNACKVLNLEPKQTVNSYGIPELKISKTKWFREFLVRVGIEKSYNKYINNKLMSMKLENISNLLKGLFDTDGFVNSKRNIGISSTSILLIYQVQKLLLRFGIISRIRERKPSKMTLHKKVYNTKKIYELIISNKNSIQKFYEKIGFNILKKKKELDKIIKLINSNICYISCNKCKYKLYKDLFGGRNKDSKVWGKQKFQVIKLLGERGEIASRELARILRFEPKKKVSRLNHHYELINKRRIGKINKSEWFWSLNNLGKWLYNYLVIEKKSFDDIFSFEKCPLCSNRLDKKLKKGWRDKDIDGDVYWDLIKKIEEVDSEAEVYDVVLSNNDIHEHLFVANGFIVHNSAGINLPARFVIIKSTYRFTRSLGSQPIPVLEFKQQSGRAGRPQFDKEGDAIAIARNEDEAQDLYMRYIVADTEDIESRLASEPALRQITLGQIATENTKTREELFDFFSETFYGYKQNPINLTSIIKEVIEFFKEEGLIKNHPEQLSPTRFGKRVSELYIDPRSAVIIREGLMRASQMPKELVTDVGILHLICSTPDVRFITHRKPDQQPLLNFITNHEDEFLTEFPTSYGDIEIFLSQLKTALVLRDWINEVPEDKILDQYGIGSGDIYNIISNAEWILYAAGELATLLNYDEVASQIKSLHSRLKVGIKEELLDLIQIPGIGRVRARTLYDNGFRNLEDLRRAKIEDLTKLPRFGKEIAEAILKFVHTGEADFSLEELETVLEQEVSSESIQKSLEDFF